jgi:hypothetical protein
MQKHLFATPDAPTGDTHAEAEEDVEDEYAGGDEDDGGNDYDEGSDDIDDWED